MKTFLVNYGQFGHAEVVEANDSVSAARKVVDGSLRGKDADYPVKVREVSEENQEFMVTGGYGLVPWREAKRWLRS